MVEVSIKPRLITGGKILFFFSTCQMRVSRFYQSYFPPSLLPSFLPHSGPFSGKVAAPFYGAYTTNLEPVPNLRPSH